MAMIPMALEEPQKSIRTIVRSLKCDCDGSSTSKSYTPTAVSGYTPIGVVGAYPFGSNAPYTNLNTMYLRTSDNKVVLGWTSAPSNSSGLYVMVLYTSNDLI